MTLANDILEGFLRHHAGPDFLKSDRYAALADEYIAIAVQCRMCGDREAARTHMAIVRGFQIMSDLSLE